MMKGIIHSEKSGIAGMKYRDLQEVHPQRGEVKVRLKTAGLNRRDLFVMNNRGKGDKPFIPGSDGAGIIEELGESVKGLKKGMEVIINPSLEWDCVEHVPLTPEILGGPSHGTFAEYVIIQANNVVQKPSYLSWKQAGVLSLSALTAYRALFTKGQLKKGEHLLIPGIGSGVATYGLLFAKAIGANVTVTSRSGEKRKQALKHGANYALDSGSNLKEETNNRKVDIILDSVGAALFPAYFEILKPNGRIVNFGASSGNEVELPLRTIFYPQFNILGTSMGSREEFVDMMDFIEKYQIKPIVDRFYPLSEAVAACERLDKGKQFGNIGLLISE
ncbi:zinc-binding alcohol dehydrogenase/oxidoreductase [Priestia megaterium]|nr:zinc-binding alcohol dehydrogenase/oxidoreductase [Priestia megaterium]